MTRVTNTADGTELPSPESSPSLAPAATAAAASHRAPVNGAPDAAFERGSGMPASEGEPSAAERLAREGTTAEWERRASWLESEARARTDSAARARLLLAASEIRAMCGARAEARRLAVSAASEAQAPTFAVRQARALGHGDADVLATGLRQEAQAAKTAATRAHAHYVAAEVARLLQHDEKAIDIHLDAAEQCDAVDLRPSLRRVVRQLGRNTKAPDVRLRPEESLRPLRQALGQVAQLRGSEAPRVGPAELSALPLVEVQRALAKGQLAEAAEALEHLASQPGLQGPIQWITAFWRAPESEAAHLDRLAALARRCAGRAEWRAVAAYALAGGDAERVLSALRESSAFSAQERVALSVLASVEAAPPAGEDPPSPDSALPRALSSALSRLEATQASPVRVGGAESEFCLGRDAARLLRFRDMEAAASDSDDGERSFGELLLRLERSREAGDLAQLAADLSRYAAAPALRAECCFVAATWSERAGAVIRARELYRAALAAPTPREAAARALSRDSTDGAAIFRALSAQTSDPQRRSSLLLETLLRLRPDAPEYDALAEEALRNDPEQSLIDALGELAARMRGDRARIARWLARARERSAQADDYAFTRLREALFLAQDNRGAAAECVRELLDSERPQPGLRQLYDELRDAPWTERVETLRQAAARSASPRVREALSFEALTLAARHEGSMPPRASAVGIPARLPWRARVGGPDPEADALAAATSARAERESDPRVLVDLYEALSHYEVARGDRDRADAWQRRIAQLAPGDLRPLRWLEISCMTAARHDELEQVAAALSVRLSGPAMLGRAFVSARLAVDRGAFSEARIHAVAALATAAPPIWALRLEVEHARAAGDDDRLLAVYLALQGRAAHHLDAVAISLRVAEHRARRGEIDAALAELERARAATSDHTGVLMLRAELAKDPREAALAYEDLAAVARGSALRAEALFRAATLWLDAVSDRERGARALRQAAECGAPHPGISARLHEVFGAAAISILRAAAPLTEAEAEDRIQRAKDLADAGETGPALRTLDEVFLFHPDHGSALLLAASLHARGGNLEAAETALWRVADVASSAERALEALRALGSLYEGALRNPERSCDVYQRILEYQPDDLAVRRRLVRELSSAGDRAGAAHHQRELVARASSDDERRDELLELIVLLAQSPEGLPEAERLLERAQRTWPENAAVLCAAAEHYRRIGNAGTARVVVERAAHAARHAIQAGRLELDLFRMLATAGRLSGDSALARCAHSALMALQGEPDSCEGASLAALDARFDELLAPAPLSPALRHFFYAAGDALERTYGPDLRHFEPSPVSDAHADDVRTLMLSCGLTGLRVMSSVPLGFDCLCSLAPPGYVVFGQALIEHPNPRVREFFLLRALKLAKVNAGALARMPPDDVWAAVAGFLACFAPAWPAAGADAQRLIVNRNKIRPHVTAAFGPELGALAAAVTANAVPQAAQLGDALWRWASRVALMATGDIGAALEAAWASSQPSQIMPRDSGARLRWLATHPQARDLVSFSVSEAYTEARRRAGLAHASR